MKFKFRGKTYRFNPPFWMQIAGGSILLMACAVVFWALAWIVYVW